MRTIAAITIIVAAALALGAAASLTSCTDTDCKHGCITDHTAPDVCKRVLGASSKYVCTDGNVSVLTYGNTECSGPAASTLVFGKEGACFNNGQGSYVGYCGASPAASIVATVVAIVAALLL